MEIGESEWVRVRTISSVIPALSRSVFLLKVKGKICSFKSQKWKQFCCMSMSFCRLNAQVYQSTQRKSSNLTTWTMVRTIKDCVLHDVYKVLLKKNYLQGPYSETMT